jgi:MYXO-CTERM domain-containing protein
VVSSEGVKGLVAVLLLSLVPVSALAQIGPDAGGDVDALQAEIDRDYAQALANDCTLACRALESMRRATERLCSLDPGDRCARARQKTDEASARVRSSCPSCAAELEGEKAFAPPAPSPAPPTETVAEEAEVSRRGGCGGCATTEDPEGAVLPLAAGMLVVLGLLAFRRRKQR